MGFSSYNIYCSETKSMAALRDGIVPGADELFDMISYIIPHHESI